MTTETMSGCGVLLFAACSFVLSDILRLTCMPPPLLPTVGRRLVSPHDHSRFRPECAQTRHREVVQGPQPKSPEVQSWSKSIPRFFPFFIRSDWLRQAPGPGVVHFFFRAVRHKWPEATAPISLKDLFVHLILIVKSLPF